VSEWSSFRGSGYPIPPFGYTFSTPGAIGQNSLVNNVLLADIATLEVNAANEGLLPSGVCEAVFRSASPKLVDACQKLAPCPTGEALITAGFLLSEKTLLML